MRILTSIAAACVSILALASVLLGAERAVADPNEQQIAAIKSACRSDFMSKCWGVPRGGTEAFQCLKKNLASLSAPCQQAVNAAIATAAPPSAPSPSSPSVAAKTASPETAAPASPNTPPPAQDSETKTAAPPELEKSKPASAAAAGSQTATSPLSGTAAKAKAIAPAAPAPKESSSSAPVGATADAPPTSAKEPSATEAAEPAEPAAMPAVPGFIPPRKKLMVLRNCRQELDTYCPGVSYGEGRQLRCLESNRAALSPNCQGALAKLAR
jgi:hypothetical protein